jgi:hypothetical protein
MWRCPLARRGPFVRHSPPRKTSPLRCRAILDRETGEALSHQGGEHVNFDVVPARIACCRKRCVSGGGIAARGAAVTDAVQSKYPADVSRPAGVQPDRPDRVEQSKQDFNLKGHPVPPLATPVDKLPIDKIKLPAGFKAEVWSSGHAGGRTMVMGDKGTMFMGSRIIGRVYAITDKGGKREPKVIIQGLTQPNGLAFRDGSLYVFAIHKVYRYDKIEDNLDKLPEPVELTKAYDLPDTVHHNWKYVAFARTERCMCRSARTATSANSIPVCTARFAGTTRMAPAWRSSRVACAIRSASTGIR